MNAIVTLNWNTTELLCNMYESANKNCLNEFCTIIVDNGSELKEYEQLLQYFFNKKNVKIFRLEKNVGFAAGNNVGLSLINDNIDLVFFINSDIIVDERNWDDKFESVMIEGVGVVGCAYHPLKWTREGRFQIQQFTRDTIIDSETVQGAFFSIPFRVLRDVKDREGFWFDEEFKFAHYEETDLCLRIMKRGYKCKWFFLEHQHLHNKSATKKNGYSLSDSIRNVEDFKNNSERNRQRLLMKHKEFFDGR